jgi:Cap4 SAVED domain
MSVFNSERVIIKKVNLQDLASFLVGFDISDTGNLEYRWKPFIDTLINVIPEFSFGYHDGTSTDNTQLMQKVIESARSIYKIKEFSMVKEIYLNNNSFIDDSIDDATLRRGEFGELILHLLLRDFFNTEPLLSKIYFKDSRSVTVHGFDAVHIQTDTKTLWLGESKLYIDGQRGIYNLLKDIAEHFDRNYLDDEFTIISKRLNDMPSSPTRDHWVELLSSGQKLSDKLNAINIPLLCTYTSDNFTKYSDENDINFINDYTTEINNLKQYFDNSFNHPFKDRLNVILILFPIKCKKEFIKKLHQKLSLLQAVGE